MNLILELNPLDFLQLYPRGIIWIYFNIIHVPHCSTVSLCQKFFYIFEICSPTATALAPAGTTRFQLFQLRRSRCRSADGSTRRARSLWCRSSVPCRRLAIQTPPSKQPRTQPSKQIFHIEPASFPETRLGRKWITGSVYKSRTPWMSTIILMVLDVLEIDETGNWLKHDHSIVKPCHAHAGNSTVDVPTWWRWSSLAQTMDWNSKKHRSKEKINQQAWHSMMIMMWEGILGHQIWIRRYPKWHNLNSFDPILV